MNSLERKTSKLVQKIPKGKVSTYGIIGKKLRINPRVIGRILNKSKGINCHRVVGFNGSLVGYNKGLKKKRELLMKEGVKVKNNKIVDFKKVLYKFR